MGLWQPERDRPGAPLTFVAYLLERWGLKRWEVAGASGKRGGRACRHWSAGPGERKPAPERSDRSPTRRNLRYLDTRAAPGQEACRKPRRPACARGESPRQGWRLGEDCVQAFPASQQLVPSVPGSGCQGEAGGAPPTASAPAVTAQVCKRVRRHPLLHRAARAFTSRWSRKELTQKEGGEQIADLRPASATRDEGRLTATWHGLPGGGNWQIEGRGARRGCANRAPRADTPRQSATPNGQLVAVRPGPMPKDLHARPGALA